MLRCADHSTDQANLPGNVSTLWTPSVRHTASCLVFICSQFLHAQLFVQQIFPSAWHSGSHCVLFHWDRRVLWNQTLFHGTRTSHCSYWPKARVVIASELTQFWLDKYQSNRLKKRQKDRNIFRTCSNRNRVLWMSRKMYANLKYLHTRNLHKITAQFMLDEAKGGEASEWRGGGAVEVGQICTTCL